MQLIGEMRRVDVLHALDILEPEHHAGPLRAALHHEVGQRRKAPGLPHLIQENPVSPRR